MSEIVSYMKESNPWMDLSKNIYALQAQARPRKARDAASDWDKVYLDSVRSEKTIFMDRGSATVEATLILPFFLCAVCTVCIIAQFILIDSAVYHATVQTARVYARQQSLQGSDTEGISSTESADLSGQKTGDSGNQSTGSANTKSAANLISKLGGILETKVIFAKYLKKEDVNASYIFGGRSGVMLRASVDKGYVNLRSEYLLRVPVLYFRTFFFRRKILIKCRTFQGYIEHDTEESSADGADVVYVTQYGNVYHTRLDCYHLTVSITDPDKVEEIMKSSHYRKCDKCIHSGQTPSQVYITKNGDCYHSSLSCSGLKRTISLVSKEECSDKRLCSECAKYE